MVRAFLAGLPWLDVRPVRDTAHSRIKNWESKVIQARTRSVNNVVVSRVGRVLEAEENSAEREKLWPGKTLTEGWTIKGIVKENLTTMAPFVDLGRGLTACCTSDNGLEAGIQASERNRERCDEINVQGS